MKAKVTNKHDRFFGRVFNVIEIIHNRIACLYIDSSKVDYGLSEIEIIPCAEFGGLICKYRDHHVSLMRDSEIEKTAMMAAKMLNQKIKVCRKSLFLFLM